MAGEGEELDRASKVGRSQGWMDEWLDDGWMGWTVRDIQGPLLLGASPSLGGGVEPDLCQSKDNAGPVLVLVRGICMVVRVTNCMVCVWSCMYGGPV